MKISLITLKLFVLFAVYISVAYGKIQQTNDILEETIEGEIINPTEEIPTRIKRAEENKTSTTTAKATPFQTVINNIKYIYTEDGVLRKNGECDLTFLNFGEAKDLSDGGKINLTNKINNKIYPDLIPFNVTINNLIFNGNITELSLDSDDANKYVKVTQKIGDEIKEITNINIFSIDKSNSKFKLKINGLDTCNGVIIKQLIERKPVQGKPVFKYTEDGVLREDGGCNLTFVNFGTEKNLPGENKIDLTKKLGNKMDVTIHNLINGNIGLNNNTVYDPTDVYKYINITQKTKDGIKEITKFNISAFGNSNSTFDLKITDIDTCEGIVIKQVFKEETVVVANRLYYVNVIPENINQSFDPKKFGPSYKYPFNRIHWKFNEGLDDLRKTCGIYMYYYRYDGFNSGEKISAHWEYYLSPEKDNKTINSKNCTPQEFFKVIRRNYIDYYYTEELLGKNYMGYVLKREGHVELHMDGVIVDNGYLVEMYQNSCNSEYESQTSCTIRSDTALTFNEFVERYIKECLNINTDEENPTWKINRQKAIGTFKNQVITIEQPSRDARGKLPDSPENELIYEEFKSDTTVANYDDATPVARFTVSFNCNYGSFKNNDCKCECK